MAFTQQEKASLFSISSLYLIRMLGLFMVLPVLSLYGAELENATPFLIGLALGIYGLAQALLQIPFGWASDRFGRKPILLFGFLLFIIGSAVCSVATSIEWLVVGRALQGAGAVSAVLLAVVADHISEQNRTTAMAVIGISIGISFGISIVAGPVVADAYGGLQGIFNLSAVLGVIALFLVLFTVSETAQPFPAKSTGQSNYVDVLSPNLLRMDFGIFSLHFMQMCIWVAVPTILIEQLGLAIDKHWVLYLTAVGGGFILMAPFMRFWDKRGQTKTSIVVAISCVLAALILMSRISSYGYFVFGLFLFFWGFNLLEATLPSSVTKLAGRHAKGTATGVYSTCQFLGVFFGGITGGWLVSEYSVTSAFYFSAALALVWLALMLPAKGLGRVGE